MRQAISTAAAPRARSLFSAHTVVTTMLCMLFAIMYLDRVNISAAAAPLKAHFNLGNTGMGLAFSAFSWSYLASVLFGGWGARKYGARVSLFVTVIIVGMAPS
jgi:sugar phosphate permease